MEQHKETLEIFKVETSTQAWLQIPSGTWIIFRVDVCTLKISFEFLPQELSCKYLLIEVMNL